MSTALIQAVGQAIRSRDQQELAKLTALDPSATLLYLDGHMRGLLPVPDAPGTQDWLLQVDQTLRAELGKADGGVAERNADLTIMRAAYGQGSLFLVAGAGIGIPAKLPGWKDLVIRVLQLVLDFGSDAQRARVAANIREGPLTFAWGEVEEHVREALAGLIPLPPDSRAEAESALQELSTKSSYTSADLMRASSVAKKCFGDRFYDHLKGILYFSGPLETTKTHQSIARMVRPAPQPHRPSPRIFSILTYNFDDLIERTIRNAGHKVTAHCSRNGQWVYQSDPSCDHRPAAIDVWHVHGYAPFDMKAPSGLDLVLTAEEFERDYGNDNSISRVVQKAHFNHALGLIIGSSLTDDYAIAQLTSAHRLKPAWFHYVVLKRPPGRTAAEYREMGLRVIWVDDFNEEIPWLLDTVIGHTADAQ